MWPFQGEFTIQLLGKDEEHPPNTATIQFDAAAISEGVASYAIDLIKRKSQVGMR